MALKVWTLGQFDPACRPWETKCLQDDRGKLEDGAEARDY